MEMQQTVSSAMHIEEAKKEAEETSTDRMPRIRFSKSGGEEVHHILAPKVPVPATALGHTPT
jgi:hypothetical protein